MNEKKQAKDMPKLESPFKRKTIDGEYVVFDEINEGYDWVFKNDDVIATEKLDGTNVSIIIEDGEIQDVWNRKNYIKPFTRNKSHHYILKAMLNSLGRGYCDNLDDGQHFGEVVGPNIQGNRYELEEGLWLPLARIHRKYHYTSWGKYPKTFEAISKWFKDGLVSLFYANKHGLKLSSPKVIPAEGIVFVHPDGRMAKLRRDMFLWFKGKRH